MNNNIKSSLYINISNQISFIEDNKPKKDALSSIKISN